MKKLRMDLDTLDVQSFPTSAAAPVEMAPPSIWDRTICICTVRPTQKDDDMAC